MRAGQGNSSSRASSTSYRRVATATLSVVSNCCCPPAARSLNACVEYGFVCFCHYCGPLPCDVAVIVSGGSACMWAETGGAVDVALLTLQQSCGWPCALGLMKALNTHVWCFGFCWGVNGSGGLVGLQGLQPLGCYEPFVHETIQPCWCCLLWIVVHVYSGL